MTAKKTLVDYSPEELRSELLRRWAAESYRREWTMSQMELLVWETC